MPTKVIYPPEKSWRDIEDAVVVAGLAAAPVIGGPAATLFDKLVTSPFEKRTQEWREEVSSTLNRIINEKDTSLEDLMENDEFLSFITRATIVAVRTHHSEKLKFPR